MFIKDVRFLRGDLNARMAMFFVQLACSFRSSVWIEKDVYRVNAKCILDVLSLKVHQNDEVRIIADGIDAKEAVEQIVEFIVNSD